ncbi:MAG: RNA polymerase sigma factor [Leptospirales bacterium]|nr:RNA polymerase sigma factor [Leptospirales bacterium]
MEAPQPSLQDLESPEFLEQLRRGEEAAFRRLVDAYRDRIYNLTLRLTRNPDDAEELTQETFLAVFDKIGGFEGRSRLSTWIYAIASNGALSRLRKKGQNSVAFDEEILARSDWERNPTTIFSVRKEDDPVLLEELQERLERAIGSLPDGYRELFILKEVQELPIKEIAGIFGINGGAVKTRLHRARLMLRARLSDYWEEQ